MLTRRAEEISRLMRGASANAILLAHTPARLLEAASLCCARRHQRSHPRRTNRSARPGALAARRFPVIAGVGKRRTQQYS